MQILHNCKHAKYYKHIISGLFVQNTPHLRIQKPCVACLWLLMLVDASESCIWQEHLEGGRLFNSRFVKSCKKLPFAILRKSALKFTKGSISQYSTTI